MVVQQTSIFAYETVNLSKNQKIMYKAILHNPGFCNKEIANYLSRSINEITPRILELRQKGKIYHCFDKQYQGKKVMCWKIKEDNTF